MNRGMRVAGHLLALAVVIAMPALLAKGKPVTGEPGELAAEFRRRHPAPVPNSEPFCDIQDNHGITEISIERTVCYGMCPAFTLRLTSDGNVEYIGRSDAAFKGHRQGKLDANAFHRLARAATDIGYFDLKDSYSCSVTDNPTVYVSATKNGTRKLIRHYAPELSGPARLSLFEQAIDAVVPSIHWSK